MDVPIGTVIAFAGITPSRDLPRGWVECDGRKASPADRVDMVALFAAIGTAWGGTGDHDFNLPDLRGIFLRGVSGISGRDPDSGGRRPAGTGAPEEVGSIQNHATAHHTHTVHDPGHRHDVNWGHDISAGRNTFERASEGNVSGPQTTVSYTGITIGGFEEGREETRPINAYIRYLIRVR